MELICLFAIYSSVYLSVYSFTQSLSLRIDGVYAIVVVVEGWMGMGMGRDGRGLKRTLVLDLEYVRRNREKGSFEKHCEEGNQAEG